MKWPSEEEDLLTEGGGLRGALFHVGLLLILFITLIVLVLMK